MQGYGHVDRSQWSNRGATRQAGTYQRQKGHRLYSVRITLWVAAEGLQELVVCGKAVSGEGLARMMLALALQHHPMTV